MKCEYYNYSTTFVELPRFKLSKYVIEVLRGKPIKLLNLFASYQEFYMHFMIFPLISGKQSIFNFQSQFCASNINQIISNVTFFKEYKSCCCQTFFHFIVQFSFYEYISLNFGSKIQFS